MKDTFILLPGWTRSIRTYKKLISQAPKNVEIIFVSYSDMSLQDIAIDFPKALLNVLNTNGLKKVSIIGHSLGGALALEFALTYPERINELYLSGPAGIYGKETLVNLASNHFRNLIEKKLKVVRAILNGDSLIKKFPSHRRLGKYAHYVDFTDRLSNLKLKTTFLWGEKDYIHPLWQGELMHKTTPNSKLIVVKGVGHDWLVYNPELFWKYLNRQS